MRSLSNMGWSNLKDGLKSQGDGGKSKFDCPVNKIVVTFLVHFVTAPAKMHDRTKIRVNYSG